jgi:meiotic recombination protein REC8
VTRRAIDNVDLRQAIQKISEPGAPLALRVQSNLLFGLSKVYEHKTRYILSDLEKIKGYLRELDRQRARKTTDPRAGRIK